MLLDLCIFKQPVYDKIAEQLMQTAIKPRSISMLFRKYHIFALFIPYNPVALSSPFQTQVAEIVFKNTRLF
jgi:hypothetical protein